MAKLINARTVLLNEFLSKYLGKNVRNLSKHTKTFNEVEEVVPTDWRDLKTSDIRDVARVAKNVYFGVQSIRVLKGRHANAPNLYTFFVSAFVNQPQQFIAQQYFYLYSAHETGKYNKLWFVRMNILHLSNQHNRKEIYNYWNATNTECGTHLFLDHTYNMQTIANTTRSADKSLLTSSRAYVNEVMPQFSYTGRYFVARKYMISSGVRESDGYRASSRFFDKLYKFGGVFDLTLNDITDADSKRYVKKYLDHEMCTDYFAVYVTDNAKLIVCDDLHKKVVSNEYQKVLFSKYGDYINSRTLFMERSLALFEGTYCVLMCETGVYYDSKRYRQLKRVKHPVFIVGEVDSEYDSLCWSVNRMNRTDHLYSGHKTDWCFRFPLNYNLIDIVEFDEFVDQCRNPDSKYFFDCRHVSREWPEGHSSKKTAAVIQCVDGIHSARFDDLRFKCEKRDENEGLEMKDLL